MNHTRTVRHAVTPFSFAVALCLAPLAFAADAPATGEVLTKIHASNQKEIQMARMAEQHGKSKDVIAYAKALIKDHTAADKKVMAFAKKHKVDLPAAPTSPKDEHAAAMEKGANFDVHFVQGMLEDHKKTIAELTEIRDNTADAKLKGLITELLPALEKHEATAQKLVDKAKL